MAVITDKQREKRIRRKLTALGKINKAQKPLLQKEDLTERDRLHLYRVLLPSMLVKCREDLAQAEIEQVDELKQLEQEILAAQLAIEKELGDERVLIASRGYNRKAVYSEPQKGV